MSIGNPQYQPNYRDVYSTHWDEDYYLPVGATHAVKQHITRPLARYLDYAAPAFHTLAGLATAGTLGAEAYQAYRTTKEAAKVAAAPTQQQAPPEVMLTLPPAMTDITNKLTSLWERELEQQQQEQRGRSSSRDSRSSKGKRPDTVPARHKIRFPLPSEDEMHDAYNDYVLTEADVVGIDDASAKTIADIVDKYGADRASALSSLADNPTFKLLTDPGLARRAYLLSLFPQPFMKYLSKKARKRADDVAMWLSTAPSIEGTNADLYYEPLPTAIRSMSPPKRRKGKGFVPPTRGHHLSHNALFV